MRFKHFVTAVPTKGPRGALLARLDFSGPSEYAALTRRAGLNPGDDIRAYCWVNVGKHGEIIPGNVLSLNGKLGRGKVRYPSARAWPGLVKAAREFIDNPPGTSRGYPAGTAEETVG